MSAPFSPRPLTGLAAAALVVGLIGAPLVASAEPTPSAHSDGECSGDTSTPSATPESRAATPSESPSARPDPTATPSDDRVTAASPSESERVDRPHPSPMTSRARIPDGCRAATARRARPTESASSAPELNAQAIAGPSITLAKSASPTRVSRVGQVITYRFAATNNGSVALSDVAITDELEGLSGLACTRPGRRRWRPGRP